MVKIAINGFGRIGRAVFRNIYEHDLDMEVVAINDLTEKDQLSYLLKYDSVYGKFDKKSLDGVEVLSEKEPKRLPWKKLGVDVVIESTGFFTDEKGASQHLKAGAKAVIISANSKTEDLPHVVMGVNELGEDKVVSSCSCTTNCAATVLSALKTGFGLEKVHMLTIHSVTSSQNLVDGSHKDWRRGRSAMLNMIPTTTGAAKAVARVLPELEGRLSGNAIRVPVGSGSLLELVVEVDKETSSEEVNQILQSVAQKDTSGALRCSDEELVSSDILATTEAAIVDMAHTYVLGNLIKITAWYDNEYGYAHRLARLAEKLGSL